MEKLMYDAGVFEEGPGRIYRKIINWTLPGLLVGAVLIALINAGILERGTNSALRFVYTAAAIYAVIGIFVFPVAWFLRSGKTRLLKESWIDVGRREVIYHRAASMTLGRPRLEEWRVTQLRRIEEKPKCYILYGNAIEKNSGRQKETLEIPRAFADMERMVQAARYKNY